MKATFNICLLFTGTLLALCPILFKIAEMIVLAILINAGKGPINLNIGEDTPYLVLPMLSGIVMILIAIVFNFATRNKPSSYKAIHSEIAGPEFRERVNFTK